MKPTKYGCGVVLCVVGVGQKEREQAVCLQKGSLSSSRLDWLTVFLCVCVSAAELEHSNTPTHILTHIIAAIEPSSGVCVCAHVCVNSESD